VPLDSQGQLGLAKPVELTDLDRLGRIPPSDLPGILQRLGLRSVMIEGGSRILSAFLRAGPREDGAPLVDSVVVTVAPMFIGDGISVVPEVSCLDVDDNKS
jgi:2,5-diamino-6-(ribosylamino)-4(3H)-pyrimidinone 5'-phosphate reductase